MLKSNYAFLDVCKFLGAILVVAMHTSPLHSLEPHLNFLLINGFSRMIVPLFFVSSGFFFFRKSPLEYHLKKYIFRLTILLVFWNTIYTVFECILYGKPFDIMVYLYSFIYNVTPLWYVEALIKGTIILFIINKYVKIEYLVLSFLILNIVAFAPSNFYIYQHLEFYDILKPLLQTCGWLRLSSLYYIGLGALFANYDITRVYNGTRLKLIIVLLIGLLLIEAVLFKYISILHGDVHRTPGEYFTMPFVVFYVFYYIINKRYLSNYGLYYRKASSVIYFSHNLFRIIFIYLIGKSVNTISYDMSYFLFVLIASMLLALYFIFKEKKSKNSLMKYLY